MEMHNAPSWEAKIRVLVDLHGTTFYDTFYEDTGKWDLARRRTYAYSRFPTQWLVEHTKWVGHEPLSEKEKLIHRADWPMFSLTSTGFSWNTPKAEYLHDFGRFVRATARQIDYSVLGGLDSGEFVICGPNSGLGIKENMTAKALNGQSFSAAELLWHSCRYFAIHDPPVNPATAQLQRLGINNQRPWYLITDQHRLEA